MLINGWSEREIELLCERTGCERAAVTHFCQAVDKQLYMLLPAHMKRATLHFHLRAPAVETGAAENIVRIEEYLRRRAR